MLSLAVFALTYVALSVPGLPLDRPAITLIGAVLMALASGFSTADALRAVDWSTIALLFGMSVIVAYLEEAGLFRWLAWSAVTRARTARALLGAVVVLSGALSALLVNDTVCLMFTPLVIAACAEAELPPLPYALALGMSANVGSAATFTGNPQNMIVGTLSGIPFARFVGRMALPAAAGVALTALFLTWAFRDRLPGGALRPRTLVPPRVDRALAARALAVLAGVSAGFVAGLSLAGTAVAGAAAVVAVGGRDARAMLQRVDYPLLVMFSSLFVLVHGVDRTGLVARFVADHRDRLLAPDAGGAVALSAATLAGSNLVSNVPFVLLASRFLPRASEGWYVLALVSTLAGNLTIVGSVANLIVLEGVGRHARVGFWQFARYGVPVTLATTSVGLVLLSLTR